MNYIDLIIVVLVILFAYKGAKRGFVQGIASILSLIAGIYCAINFSVVLEDKFSKHMDGYIEFISIISFISVFLIVFLFFKLSGFIVKKLVKSLYMGFFDKVFGMIFGVSKIALILSILLFEEQHLSETFGSIIPNQQKTESVLYSPVYNIVLIIAPTVKENNIVPRNIKQKIKNKIQEKKDFILE